MSAALKKKIIVVVIITIILGVLAYQSHERDKKMQEFIQMQNAPLKKAEENQLPTK